VTKRHLVAFVALVAAVPAAGQIETTWGDPDLQGGWSCSTLMPLERPDNLAEREVFTDEEVAHFASRHSSCGMLTAVTRTVARGIVNGTEQTSDLARSTISSGGTEGLRLSGRSAPH
jgi:hypothetical protein